LVFAEFLIFVGRAMGYSSPGNGVENVDPSRRATTPQTGEPSESGDLVAVLRRNLNEGLQPPAAIMHATAEATRILTGADGAALALRTRGVIVCRACSGDPTPDLGTPLNLDSGISGECLRAASILVCDDTESDTRVDPEVCRYLGIRSIVVVPLRGPAGIAGILEAFATRVRAFGEEQINSLRQLAEIAEAAYGREVRGLQEAPVAPRKTASITLLSDEPASGTRKPEALDDISPARRVWVIGIAVVAMLLIAGVWLSGHEPALETSAKEPTAELHNAARESAAVRAETVRPPKPKAGIRSAERSAAEALKNAARIETVEDAVPVPVKAATSAASGGSASGDPASGAAGPDPASLAIRSSLSESATGRDELARLAAAPNTLPSLGAPVSQGMTPGKLIHKVDPVYPAQARMQRVSGIVALEITIAEDGSVRDVKLISGPAMLATAASDALRKWRYTPFLLNGKPLEVQKQISVIFKLPSGE
jgi:periplasmic protein TonB